MFNLRTVLTALLLIVTTVAMAQKRILVLDMDTRMPVKDVTVKTNKGPAVVTDYTGRATLQMPYDSISFTHIKYESEHLTVAELTDTMLLLPKEHFLGEVKVLGVNPALSATLQNAISEDRSLYAPRRGIIQFDFANIIDRRGRRDRKHHDRAKKILKQWDEAPQKLKIRLAPQKLKIEN